MLRGLLAGSCVLVAGGCTALNPVFGDTDGGAGGTRGSATMGESGVETVGDSVATSKGGSSSGDATVGTHGSSEGSSGGLETSSESGWPDCLPSLGPLDDDAFLVRCVGGGCGDRNYGQTGSYELAERGGDEHSVLLLKLPVYDLSVSWMEVTVFFRVDDSFDAPILGVSATAIEPPCDWEEGLQDGDYLDQGDPGVTYRHCDGNPASPVPWIEELGDFQELFGAGWLREEVFIPGLDVPLGEPFSVTFSFDGKDGPPVPDTLAVGVVEGTLGRVSVFSAEAEDPKFAPYVQIWPDCD
ncbi:MAG: hypothetical protein KUG77_04360 [Nannocystaceae bacterium]|nr:hypothetical protein [Nannocystaceae bacterium]